MSFAEYVKAGFLSELLPILPHNAAILPTTPAHDALVANKGKVPGRKTRDGWVGFKDWTSATPTPDHAEMWAGWGAGVGMQGRLYPALDIDVNDEALADAIHKEAVSFLGAAPARYGRGARRILVYAGAGLAKRRLAFGHAGRGAEPDAADQGDRVLDRRTGATLHEVQAVEFLAAGQQYVVEGVHPKTGAPYRWEGRSLAGCGPDGLHTVSAERIDAFLARVEGLIDLFGYEVKSRSASSASAGEVYQMGLLAPSFDAIKAAVAAIRNDVDYDTWISIGAAIKASAGPEYEAEALELWVEFSLQWPENDAELATVKWHSLEAPYKAGWDYLQRFATDEGDGTFYGASEEFDCTMAAPVPASEDLGTEAEGMGSLAKLFRRYVWVEKLKVAADTQTGAMLDKEQFNVRHNYIASPNDKKNPWVLFTSETERLKRADSLTYRPGGTLFVDEDGEGHCLNVWKPSPVAVPDHVGLADVKPWLDHVAYILPNEEERETVLNWLAWIVQNPHLKPNWSLVIGSSAEGLGKDLMLEPLRAALGPRNVSEITPDDLNSGYTHWLEHKRLVIVEEMQVSERRDMENRLKPLVSAPPYTLQINVKYQRQYSVPNIVAAIFFTNMDNALVLRRSGRRYYVVWNDGQPKADSYYRDLVAWYRGGGAAKAARYLMSRDIAGFSATGRAPETAARLAMQQAGRSPLEEWLEDAIADEVAPFDMDVVALEDVYLAMPEYVAGRFRPTRQRFAKVMRGAGCSPLGRVRLPDHLGGARASLWAVRRHATYDALPLDQVRDLHVAACADRDAA